MAKIIAPNKKYNGTSASVPFVNGVGETDNQNLIQWFKENGYTVESVDSPSVPEVIPETDPEAVPEVVHEADPETVPEPDPEAVPEVVQEADPENVLELENMSVEELTSFASNNGIDIGRATSKDTILKKIIEAGAENGTPER